MSRDRRQNRTGRDVPVTRTLWQGAREGRPACLCDNRSMPDETPPAPTRPLTPLKVTAPNDDKVLCERCGDEMYRMHAVWRCPGCGYKTDCCGW